MNVRWPSTVFGFITEPRKHFALLQPVTNLPSLKGGHAEVTVQDPKRDFRLAGRSTHAVR